MTPDQLQARLALTEEYLTLATKELHDIRELSNLQQHVQPDSPLVNILEEATHFHL